MTGEDRLLVQLLGYADAVWAPPRRADWGSYATTNLYFARQRYDREGSPWASRERDEVVRKRQQRRLEALAASGLATPCGRSGRTIGVRLTTAGESRARAMADLPSVSETYLAMQTLVAFTAPYRALVWVSEVVLLLGWDGAYDQLEKLGEPGRILWEQDATFTPAIARGMAEANSDCQGRVYYIATERGIEWAVGPAPERVSALPGADREAAELYLQARQERREAFRFEPPERRHEVGVCALPVSGPTIRAMDGASAPARRRRAQRKAAKKTARSKAKTTRKKK